METAYCPRCKKDVEIPEPWDEFQCPICHLEGFWDEQCLEDYSDCWPTVVWREKEDK